ncbi:MAG: hypothetical protein WCB58_04530 [Acidobacteriaceae bacterium]
MHRIFSSPIHLMRACALPLCLATLLLCSAFAAHAQGCSMCRDTTAGSAPQIRAGLRRAIPVLAIPAIAIFLGFFVVARRTDTWHRSEEPHTIDDDDR